MTANADVINAAHFAANNLAITTGDKTMDFLLEHAMGEVDNLANNARISTECRKALYAEWNRLFKERYGREP